MPDELVFLYERASDYRIIAVSGVWGGVTGQGMVMFDLLTEFVKPPERIRHSLTAERKLGPETSREQEQAITRLSQIGVMVTPDIAESIGKWLVDRAEKARARQAQKSQTPGSS